MNNMHYVTSRVIKHLLRDALGQSSLYNLVTNRPQHTHTNTSGPGLISFSRCRQHRSIGTQSPSALNLASRMAMCLFRRFVMSRVHQPAFSPPAFYTPGGAPAFRYAGVGTVFLRIAIKWQCQIHIPRCGNPSYYPWLSCSAACVILMVRVGCIDFDCEYHSL